MTNEQIETLFDANVREIDKMDVASGSMIKALLMGIEKNGPAYIRLKNAADNGHRVEYEYVEGDRTLVERVSRVLGLKYTVDTLEVES